MKLAKIIAWLYLFYIITTILNKGIDGMLNTIGTVGNILVTVAIMIVVIDTEEKKD